MFVVPREENHTYLCEGHGKTTDDLLVFKKGSRVVGAQAGHLHHNGQAFARQLDGHRLFRRRTQC